MKKYFQFISSVLFVTASISSFAALDRLSDFALLDADGEFHQLSRYQHKKALIIMAFDENCASMEEQLETFSEIQQSSDTDDFTFLLLDTTNRSRDDLTILALQTPILEDGGQLVAESLSLSQTGEVLVLNPTRLSLFYRGGPSSQLRGALDLLNDGSISDTIETQVSGCEIVYPMLDAHQATPPDYANEVAPVIIENCVDCHRQGGVGPFAMDSHIMLMGWSPMIREVLLNKRMPPTQVDPYIGHSENARYLNPEELQTVIHWIDAGAPRGESETDPLEDFEPNQQEWVLGEPDYIVTAPKHDIPRTGVLDYYYKNVELPFEEDKWIRAVQFNAGDESVLHHLMVFVTAPGEDFWGAERDQTTVTRRFVGGYSPGTYNVNVYPEGTGVFVPAGHSLSMQFHYVTNGQSTEDSTNIGLYFSEEENLREKLLQAVGTRFDLPANTANYPQLASYQFDEPVMLTGVRARMNYRGKKMKFAIERNDGSVQEVFSVPAYNYGWQPHYVLSDSIPIESGEKVIVSGALDNSVSNPTNPDATREISYGLESWEEMFTGYFSFYSLSP